jgi:hypothetical protein
MIMVSMVTIVVSMFMILVSIRDCGGYGHNSGGCVPNQGVHDIYSVGCCY